MNGGIDAVYSYVLGPAVEQALQALIVEQFGGELPVGQAAIVPTGRNEIPWCISAPTMRVPEGVPDTANAYLAFRAALRAIAEHNQSDARPIQSLLCPGLGTAVGSMPAARCARQMRVAWNREVLGQTFVPRNLREAAADHAALLR